MAVMVARPGEIRDVSATVGHVHLLGRRYYVCLLSAPSRHREPLKARLKTGCLGPKESSCQQSQAFALAATDRRQYARIPTRELP